MMERDLLQRQMDEIRDVLGLPLIATKAKKRSVSKSYMDSLKVELEDIFVEKVRDLQYRPFFIFPVLRYISHSCSLHFTHRILLFSFVFFINMILSSCSEIQAIRASPVLCCLRSAVCPLKAR
jgi:hypothetical protein